MLKSLWLCSVILFAGTTTAAENPLAELVTDFCARCHGGDEPQADLRLDSSEEDLFQDSGRIKVLVDVLQSGDMPPSEERQPPDELRAAAVEYLKTKSAVLDKPGRLKRLTRDEYANTINDLFDADFDLTGVLPPDPSGDGFNKWGRSQRMSPHQVESYLRAARYVSDRLILDKRPTQRSWEFTIDNFRGTGRGDFQTDREHVLTTHYPWRSILYFVEPKDDSEPIFRIPEYGRYWIQADAAVRFSEKAETISLSTGDPRYPTNIRKIERAVLPPDADSVFLDVTLTADAHVSFTYDSAATWNTGKKAEKYEGRQVRFSKVRITGPVTDRWPTDAVDRIFDGVRYRSLTEKNSRAFTEHVIGLLMHRPLPEGDVSAFSQLVSRRIQETGDPNAAARTLLTALLSSPHFVYKHETDSLDNVALAHRLSYFLWNSVPDQRLLNLADSGTLRAEKTLTAEVQRMLDDPRSDRFCEDFTRQWLATDKIDDIGPDDRVHDKKKVTFMKIRELAKEPYAFFREILREDLSMINFIDSEFLMVNDETSEYYDLGRVRGRNFRRVSLPADSERGGLIGQAGLLKLSSSKHATSPILRGTWILKNIYGQKLSPPPGLAVEEPDIRGAETVKEVIQMHQSTETCNRCHCRIDPFGLALEHYDEMGLWRDQYRHIETSVGDKTIKKHMAPIDSTAELPDGRSVSSMTELKAVFLEDKQQIIRAILSKLASYALGREMSFSDEAMIDQLYRQVEEDDYTLRSAIDAIVAHESFARK